MLFWWQEKVDRNANQPRLCDLIIKSPASAFRIGCECVIRLFSLRLGRRMSAWYFCQYLESTLCYLHILVPYWLNCRMFVFDTNIIPAVIRWRWQRDAVSMSYWKHSNTVSTRYTSHTQTRVLHTQLPCTYKYSTHYAPVPAKCRCKVMRFVAMATWVFSTEILHTQIDHASRAHVE